MNGRLTHSYKGGLILPQGILAANASAEGRALIAQLRGLRFVYVGGSSYSSPNTTQAATSASVDAAHIGEQQLWTSLGELGISVVHIPSLPEHELDEAYKGAVALSYLSHSEGFGLPVLEAMKCSCPVLLRRTNVASMHVARGVAVALSDEDVLGLGGVRAVVTLVTSNQARNGLGNRGRKVAQKYAQVHTWSRAAEMLASALMTSTTTTPDS
jgi:glycosyltransferase involved in cell wall biosynthesis